MYISRIRALGLLWSIPSGLLRRISRRCTRRVGRKPFKSEIATPTSTDFFFWHCEDNFDGILHPGHVCIVTYYVPAHVECCWNSLIVLKRHNGTCLFHTVRSKCQESITKGVAPKSYPTFAVSHLTLWRQFTECEDELHNAIGFPSQ